VVRKYNADPTVNGILVQLPLPKHINEEKVLGAVHALATPRGRVKPRVETAEQLAHTAGAGAGP
jgi:hypothetical protein